MPDLLLELFSEEIPARMQARAAEDLKKLVTDALVERGVLYEGAVAYVTPRRLTLHVVGLPARQPDVKEERKGPRVGAPEAAIQGFLKAAGLASLDQATIVEDKKGSSYVAIIEKPGRATPAVIGEIMPGIIRGFPWPKSMRWGTGTLRWVRPLQSILCLFGSDLEEQEIIPFEIDGLVAGDTTEGHRFMAPGRFAVRRFDDYAQKLDRAKVVLDAARRREIILHDARNLCFAQGLELVEDEAVLNEAAGLVEWPVVLMGEFEARFLAIPPEVIQTTIRANQKCFVVRDGKTGALTNRFVLISNLLAEDGGAMIIAGNGRVIRARLSDAKFFYETDLSRRLEDRLPKLKDIVFHARLGTQQERVTRLKALARAIAPVVGADPDKAERAAALCKADLVTEVVGEFPELQGLMGKYYALAQGEDAAVAAACEEHYKPQGPSDRVPSDPVSVAVALADKLDTLVGFWAIDEKPTGSKDPYALRRAALGVIRILLENGVRLSLTQTVCNLVFKSFALQKIATSLSKTFPSVIYADDSKNCDALWMNDLETVFSSDEMPTIFDYITFIESKYNFQNDYYLKRVNEIELDSGAVVFEFSPSLYTIDRKSAVVTSFDASADLLAFFADRLKVYLRDRGARHDLVTAVFALPGQDDLLMIVRRVEALGRFLDAEDGKSLLAGYRRAVNILRAEEKKDGEGAFAGGADAALLAEPAERALGEAVSIAKSTAAAAVAREDFEGAMTALATLRAPVDAFFEAILVNAEDAALRRNRLKLLDDIRAATLTVADFSKIEG